MGREVKRVPMDFDWPIRQVWAGYLNPHYQRCSSCNGSGVTMGRQRLSDIIGLLMLSGDDAAQGRCHPYFRGDYLCYTAGETPTPDLAELTVGLAGRPQRLLGHDACDRWKAIDAIIAAAGLDSKTWGLCPACAGEGENPETKEASDSWDRSEPPDGDGWQMWETTSEGSPISPVFATPEGLAEWLDATGASAVGSRTATSAQWLAMIHQGWAPSAIADSGGLRSGVVAVGETTDDRP